ncbi:hypothetical protein BJ165DRAFT_1528675 [Panaeolus papilionaceus]|nr:hypothetical protein BJ165DRAFT_1528675 [Panaeolus papilionaceus]
MLLVFLPDRQKRDSDKRNMASSSSQSSIFPLEIFHLILKNLSRSELIDDETVHNTNDLRRGSLVSKPAPVKIIHAIDAHPKIASYVQRIRRATVAGNKEGHNADQNISISTLLQLHNLRSLSIRLSTTPTKPVLRKFDRLCADDVVLLRLWQYCIFSESLVDLTLHNIDDPQPVSNTVLAASKIESLKLSSVKNLSYSFLSFIPHLKELSVSEVTWRIPLKSRDQLISTFRGLEKLTFDYAYGDVRHLWVYIPLSIAAGMGVKLFEHLQDLTVMPESEQEAEEIYQALQHAPTIHYLDVKLTKSSIFPYLNLRQLLPQTVGSLKTLHIRFCISDYHEWDDTIEVISEALSLLKSPASLEQLVLTITIDSTYLLALFGMIQQLKILDALLFTDASMFPLLRWITIRICVEHWGDWYMSPKVDNKMQADLYNILSPLSRHSEGPLLNLVSTSSFGLKRSGSTIETTRGSASNGITRVGQR